MQTAELLAVRIFLKVDYGKNYHNGGLFETLQFRLPNYNFGSYLLREQFKKLFGYFLLHQVNSRFFFL